MPTAAVVIEDFIARPQEGSTFWSAENNLTPSSWLARVSLAKDRLPDARHRDVSPEGGQALRHHLISWFPS